MDPILGGLYNPEVYRYMDDLNLVGDCVRELATKFDIESYAKVMATHDVCYPAHQRVQSQVKQLIEALAQNLEITDEEAFELDKYRAHLGLGRLPKR